MGEGPFHVSSYSTALSQSSLPSSSNSLVIPPHLFLSLEPVLSPAHRGWLAAVTAATLCCPPLSTLPQFNTLRDVRIYGLDFTMPPPMAPVRTSTPHPSPLPGRPLACHVTYPIGASTGTSAGASFAFLGRPCIRASAGPRLGSAVAVVATIYQHAPWGLPRYKCPVVTAVNMSGGSRRGAGPAQRHIFSLSHSV